MKLTSVNKNNKNEAIYIIGYFLFLVIFWTIARLYILPQLEKSLTNLSFLYALSEAIIKILIWTVPIYIILTLQKVNVISFLKLNSNVKKGIAFGLLMGLAFIIIHIIKVRGFNKHITYTDFINTFLLVGIIEEISFRGYLMQKLKIYMNSIKSNILTSIMFMAIHVPIALYNNNIDPLYFIQVGILSFIFGHFFEETDSLICPIIMHSLWDLSIVITQIAK